MKGKLAPKDSFVLYGVWIAVVFGLFVLGLYWGKGQAAVTGQEITTQPVGSTLPTVPRDQVQSRLDLAAKETSPAGGDEQAPAPSSSSPTASPQVTEVKPAATAPETAVDPPAAAPGSLSPRGKESFSIQVGALNTEEEARKLIVRLQDRGYTGILDKPTSKKDPFYRVRVGSYSTREEALRAEVLLKDEGFLTFVKKTK